MDELQVNLNDRFWKTELSEAGLCTCEACMVSFKDHVFEKFMEREPRAGFNWHPANGAFYEGTKPEIEESFAYALTATLGMLQRLNKKRLARETVRAMRQRFDQDIKRAFDDALDE